MSKKGASILLLRSPWFKKSIKFIWIFLVCGVVVLPLYILAVNQNLFGLFGGMPDLKEIENPENDLSSELISSDGVSLGRYFRYNRSQVSYDQLSPDLVNTLIYSEDHRFHDHSGLDFRAYIRVITGIVTFNARGKGGGSTITQQLAKNLFRTRGRELDGTLTRSGPLAIIVKKTKEWIIAFPGKYGHLLFQIQHDLYGIVTCAVAVNKVSVRFSSFNSRSKKSLDLSFIIVDPWILSLPVR